ncbi:uncharacterized protein AKAW2_10132S [Aspergillus luchuensis]|uniref:Uncharacterized protein n=1 Tax=Aspergillus kawachii TaxID=1069201 RepID=A0A7R7VYG4_ASPKA|nr:uncharacterized protein AKAW2_10132S [Aspergillus luchuensis]BCR93086.1 hypothetical protein AKAW2_10132S [Aspergillus luchuensis]BCS05742.1 hypothetical protein ALUC_10123S [Aspergillus luchuensis]GAA86908.1 DUF341 family oxidoreductase [Aspergillus luchuensis IFO 4308]
MTIICLHGGYGSAEQFQIQLKPLTTAMQSACPDISFHFIDGGYPVTPPQGYADLFGQPPHYRFIEYDETRRSDDLLGRVNRLSRGSTVEDTMQFLNQESEVMSADSVRGMMAKLFAILEENPDIDGILGFSEGVTAAASLLVEEDRRVREEGKTRQLKYGIFFAGWPPVRLDGQRVTGCLADECEDMIVVPTCHIIGVNDPFVDASMALYGVCDPDTAIMFDHGKGHTVPRDAKTVSELVEVIDQTRRKGLDAGL